MSRRLVVVCVLAVISASSGWAQPGCTVDTLATLGGWSPLPTRVGVNVEGTNVELDDINGAVEQWGTCSSSPLQVINGVSLPNSLIFGEAWTVRQGTFEDFGRLEVKGTRCAEADPATFEIRLFTDPPVTCHGLTVEHTITHELGRSQSLTRAL